MSESDLTTVSVEDPASGRILTGVGAEKADLEATMERFAPEKPAGEVAPSPPAAPPAGGDSLAANSPAGPEKPTRGQRRYSQLTSERDQEAHKRAEVERERDDLKARIAALESRAPSPAPAQAASAPAPVSQKFTYPTYDAAVTTNPNLTWDDWNDGKIEARAKYELQQVNFDALVRDRIEADQASRAFTTKAQAVLDRGRASIPDFDAVFRGSSNPMIGPTQQSDLERAKMIWQQPNAEHIIYAISKDANVGHALARMNDVQFGMALASIAPASAVASPASTASAGSAIPPPPYQPVGSGSQTTSTPSADLPKKAGFDFDKSGYREKRAAERGVARRR